MTNSTINWKLPRYVVGVCWLISLLLYVGSKALHLPLNPFPKVLAAIFGVLVHGYVGAGKPYEGAIIIVYATVVGLGLSWWLRNSKSRAGVIIGITVAIHILLFFLSIPPLMLIGGR